MERLPEVERALNWAYSNGYTGAYLAGAQYAGAAGITVKVISGSLYSDTLYFAPAESPAPYRVAAEAEARARTIHGSVVVPKAVHGTHKTGSIPSQVTPEMITTLLGFGPDPDGNDGDGKVTMWWSFTVDGHDCAIWDYKGDRWSVYDPHSALLPLILAEGWK